MNRRPSHIHFCPACHHDFDHYDSGCQAPLEHRCRHCWTAWRALEQVYHRRGVFLPQTKAVA